MSPAELLAGGVAAAEAGAAILLRYFRSDELEVRTKSKNDLVSQADHESEAAVVAEILRRFPDHRILAEEGSLNSGATSEYEWVIDPLDGTTNFLQGLPIWAVSIALGSRLTSRASASTRLDDARWSRRASAWRRPCGVSPVQPTVPATRPLNPA